MFYALHRFAAVQKLEQEFQENHDALVKEFLWAYFLGIFKQWPEKINTKQKWLVAGCRWQGEPTDEAMYFPVLQGIVQKYPMIQNAGFSALLPGAEIAPHKGYTDKVLRFHYGLIVPGGDMGMKVGDQQVEWREKYGLLFDDTVEHSAWNKTPFSRAVILIDLRRKK